MSNRLFNRLACLFLALILLASIPAVSYAYWGNLSESSSNKELSITTDEYGFFEGNPIDRLPPQVPQYIVDRLNEIDESYPEDILESLVDAVGKIVDYMPIMNESIPVIIGGSGESLFDDGPLSEEAFIMYVTEIDGEQVVSFVHISKDSNYVVRDLEDLYFALSQPWTGVNGISSMWLRGNQYNTFNSPLEYEGRLYLMNFNGPSGNPPESDLNTWFLKSINYEYIHENRRYYQGYIVEHSGDYYIARNNVFQNEPTTTGWSPWDIINLWQNGTIYPPNSVVRTIINGEMRFFRALMTCNNIEPNVSNCQLGYWQEINNGWIGSGNHIISHYFEHNNYLEETSVIFGVSPRLKYNYFTSIRDVPSGEPPLIRDENGTLQINSQYWRVY